MTKDTTRDRILTAASAVFEAKGFEKTTVRDICAKADVNVAAINYHFRDKQNLFYEVLSHWMEDFMVSTGIREKVDAADTPEKKLRTYIRTELGYMCKTNDPDGIQLNRVRLMLQELTAENHNPDIFCPHEKLEEELLLPVIKELTGSDDPEILKHASICATAMTTHYFLMALDDKKFTIETHKDLDFIADILTSFAIGGLKAIKENYSA